MAFVRGLAGLAVLLLALPLACAAQPRAKVYRIGYIQTATPEEQAPLTKAFEEGLRLLGYVEGGNVVFERRFAWGDQKRLPELATELAALKVDVIVTGGNPVIVAVQRATRTIPVVMTTSRDPVGSGFVASLARPGGNITGISADPTPEVQSKRLELLLAAVPCASSIGLLWNPLPPAAKLYRDTVGSAARKHGVVVHAVEARGREDFERAFAALTQYGVGGVVVLPDPVFFTARKQVVELAAKHRVPAVYHARELVEEGGLMSYGSSLDYQFRRAATYVDRILKGAKPGELPVEQATKFELVINMRAAKALGIAVPATLRLQADEVIE